MTDKNTVLSALSFSVAAIALFMAANGINLLGSVQLYTEQFIALIMGFAIGFVLLAYSVQGRLQDAAPIYDKVLAALGIFVGLFIAVRFPVLSRQFYSHPVETAIAGFLLVPLLIEALRRTAGLGLVAVVAVFLIYAVFADWVPGNLEGLPVNLFEFLPFLAIDSTAIFGTPLSIVASIVIIYIIFGKLLSATGGSNWFTDIAISLVGHYSGGAAKIAILASTFFGSISGSAVANVVSTGVITIPLMKKTGFSARSSAAFEAVASTGGQIMPPVMGAAAFLMAEFLEVPYAEVVGAAIIPALLFFFSVLAYADIEARRLKIPPVPADMIKPISQVFKEGWYFPIPFVVLIYCLFSLHLSPDKAALWAGLILVILNLIFGYQGDRLNLRRLLGVIADGGRGAVDIVIVGAIAGIVIGVLEATGLGFGLTFTLIQFGKESLFFLLIMTAVICIVLGMGMPTTGIYLLVATLAAPPLIGLGLEPMAVHLFILYFGLLSMISPPVALAAFTAASIAGTRPMKTALTSVKVGWVAFVVPMVFVYSPGLLLRDTFWVNLITVATAFVGVLLVSIGVGGYFKKPLGIPSRIVFLILGAACLFPKPLLGF